jgi:Cdc6-like AAA superfamily ATPase
MSTITHKHSTSLLKSKVHIHAKFPYSHICKYHSDMQCVTEYKFLDIINSVAKLGIVDYTYHLSSQESEVRRIMSSKPT